MLMKLLANPILGDSAMYLRVDRSLIRVTDRGGIIECNSIKVRAKVIETWMDSHAK